MGVYETWITLRRIEKLIDYMEEQEDDNED